MTKNLYIKALNDGIVIGDNYVSLLTTIRIPASVIVYRPLGSRSS